MSELSPGVLDMIERLIAMDTTSRNPNLEAIEMIRQYLEGLGAVCRLTFDTTGKKANLYATLGPADVPGVMLSGHTDVVPVDGQNWSTDPFRLTRKGDKFFGRGTADMKSFCALALALAPEFVAMKAPIPLHFSFSCDEELGCIGVPRLIADMVTLPVRPRFGIIGEPTEMKVVTGQKGKRSLKCHVHGKECHSSQATGVNAVVAAAEVIAHIAEMQRKVEKNGPFDPRYSPPYTTLHTGFVHGGTALNIVPKDCSFEYEIRALPIDDPDRYDHEIRDYAAHTVEAWMKTKDAKTGIAIDLLDDTAGFDRNDSDEVVQRVFALTGANEGHKVSFGTEAGLFNDAGVPTVVCGPGAIEQAHRPDEFISLDQLHRGEAFIRSLFKQMCA